MTEFLVLLGVFVVVRAHISFNAGMFYLGRVHKRNVRAINEGWMKDSYSDDYNVADEFYIRMLQIHKWTPAQFYPNKLEGEE